MNAPGSRRVAVVVPVLDMVSEATACATAVVRQDLPAEQFRLLFVDNGSTDGTPEALSRLGVAVTEERRPGAAAARNRGIAETGEPLVAFLDADCVPSRGWLRELIAPFDDPEVNGVSGSLVPLEPWRSPFAEYAAAIGQYDARRTLHHPRFPYAPTGNLAVRRTVLERVGAFDPELLSYEGAELFHRIRAAGLLRWEVADRALAFFRPRADWRTFARQNWTYGRGWGRFLRRYGAASGEPVRIRTAAFESFGRRLVGGRKLPPRLWPQHLVREVALLGGALSSGSGGGR
jgi:glycosyltransferase involved in cell wall biosynthesis